jgi:hypothetical protein
MLLASPGNRRPQVLHALLSMRAHTQYVFPKFVCPKNRYQTSHRRNAPPCHAAPQAPSRWEKCESQPSEALLSEPSRAEIRTLAAAVSVQERHHSCAGNCYCPPRPCHGLLIQTACLHAPAGGRPRTRVAAMPSEITAVPWPRSLTESRTSTALPHPLRAMASISDRESHFPIIPSPHSEFPSKRTILESNLIDLLPARQLIRLFN